MPTLINLEGQRFGRLVVQGGYIGTKQGAQWLCVCDCGNTVRVRGQTLRGGIQVSCGCYSLEQTSRLASEYLTKHGMAGTPEYKAWFAARLRCTKPTDQAWANYGGRGITMAPEWLDDFMAFYEHIGPRPEGRTLDRIDNDGNYEPGNVRWATRSEQQRNRRPA